MLVLDTGGLIAFERGDRHVAALVEAARRRRDQVVTSSGCVAQAWRDGARQALLARLLAGVNEVGLDRRSSRKVGELCAATGTSDVIDSHLTLLVSDGDIVVTSDTEDLRTLLGAAHIAARIVSC